MSISTSTHFDTLVHLYARDYVSPADYARIGRLVKIVARRTNMTERDVAAGAMSAALNLRAQEK